MASTQQRPVRSRIPKPDEWFSRLTNSTLEKIIRGSLGIDWSAGEIAAARAELSRRTSSLAENPVGEPRLYEGARGHKGRGPDDGNAGVREPRRPRPTSGDGSADPPADSLTKRPYA
jgi:hypothetical protein